MNDFYIFYKNSLKYEIFLKVLEDFYVALQLHLTTK